MNELCTINNDSDKMSVTGDSRKGDTFDASVLNLLKDCLSIAEESGPDISPLTILIVRFNMGEFSLTVSGIKMLPSKTL
jgi:hypothetical protein